MEDELLTPEQHQQMVDIFKSKLQESIAKLNSIDLDKALEQHNAMEELKKKMGVS